MNNPVASISDTTIRALQQENQRLKRAVEELSFLNELAAAIGASANLQEIIQTIVRRSLHAVHAEQGVITLVGAKAGDPMKTLVRGMDTSSINEPFRPNQTLMGWMHLHKTPVLLNDPRRDERFSGVNWDASVVSLACVPLLVKSELKGVLTVYNKKGGQCFTEDDQRLLAIIAGQSAQVIENARLSEEELRMREQMRLAAKIQFDLLPKAAPQIAGYDIAGKSFPAQSVGGDYFDFIAVDQNRLAVCLGDVSGKGLPAALLMANLQATIRAQTLVEATAHICVGRSNRLICQNTDRCNFITFFYALLNHREHRLSYANAGHNPPLLFTGNNRRQLSCRGLVLGIRDNFVYEEETFDLQAGDLLLIYSDGVVEAMNDRYEEFGEERLVETVSQSGEGSAGGLIEKIMQALKKHAGRAVQSDDITLVVVKRVEGMEPRT